LLDFSCLPTLLISVGKVQTHPTLGFLIAHLGVFLMKKLMDKVRFELLGERGNLLTMVKYRANRSKKKMGCPSVLPLKKFVLSGEEP